MALQIFCVTCRLVARIFLEGAHRRLLLFPSFHLTTHSFFFSPLVILSLLFLSKWRKAKWDAWLLDLDINSVTRGVIRFPLSKNPKILACTVVWPCHGKTNYPEIAKKLKKGMVNTIVQKRAGGDRARDKMLKAPAYFELSAVCCDSLRRYTNDW